VEEEQDIKFKMVDGIKFKREYDTRLDHIDKMNKEINEIKSKENWFTDNETLRALKLIEKFND